MTSTEPRSPHTTALRIAGVYALFGALWIYFSDHLVEGLATTQEQLTAIQTIKGWAFVLMSAVILHGMVVHEHRRLFTTNDRLETALQQAHILHRILRHNLRNICSIIGGTIDRIEAGSDDQLSHSLEVLTRQNERLINLSHKSRFLRDFLIEEACELNEYDLVTLVHRTVEDARQQYATSEINVETPSEAFVRAHHQLDGAIEELIENAIEHNPSENAAVWLSVEPGDEWVTLIVEDNGPGIPRSEQSTHRSQYETAMEHSQGLGLWLIRLMVEQSGGDIVIETGEPEGSRIVLQLPVA